MPDLTALTPPHLGDQETTAAVRVLHSGHLDQDAKSPPTRPGSRH
jgi:hypothetical protein